MNPAKPTTVARFVPDQVVAATRHAELVAERIRDVQKLVSDAQVGESDPRLGLSLIKLTYHGDARLDDVLKSVYAGFEKDFEQWVPTFGKNRLLERIDRPGADDVTDIGVVGHIDIGGDGIPTALDGLPEPDPQRARKGAGVSVALLDTELYPHERFAGRIIDDDPFLPIGAELPFPAGHATFVAGLALQRAPRTRLHILSPLRGNHVHATAWDVARRMADLRDQHDVAILNLSVGCYTVDGKPPLVLRRAVELLAPSVVIVAAAGNHGNATEDASPVNPKSPFWPAALDDVVAVGALDQHGSRAAFSPELPWVNLMAPGVGVASTYLTGKVNMLDNQIARAFTGYAAWGGTSFAAAAVTGEIAAEMGANRDARHAVDALLRRAPDGQDDIRPPARRV